MPDTKHTPGPWEVVDTRLKVVGRHALHGGLSVVSRGKETVRPSEYYDNGYLVAESFEAEEHGNPIGLLEGEANAQLIAAAPDMLKALEAAGVALRQYEVFAAKFNGPYQYSFGRDTEAAIATLIAKAKGEVVA